MKARAHPSQLIGGSDRQPGRIPLGNRLGCFRQGRYRRRDALGEPGGQQYGDPGRQYSANQGDGQERVGETRRTRRTGTPGLRPHRPGLAGWLAVKIEHRLPMSLQGRCGGAGRQLRQGVNYHPAIGADDYNPHPVLVGRLRVFSPAFSLTPPAAMSPRRCIRLPTAAGPPFPIRRRRCTPGSGSRASWLAASPPTCSTNTLRRGFALRNSPHPH